MCLFPLTSAIKISSSFYSFPLFTASPMLPLYNTFFFVCSSFCVPILFVREWLWLPGDNFELSPCLIHVRMHWEEHITASSLLSQPPPQQLGLTDTFSLLYSLLEGGWWRTECQLVTWWVHILYTWHAWLSWNRCDVRVLKSTLAPWCCNTEQSIAAFGS